MQQPLISEVVKNFLILHTLPDLAKLYNSNMEVQIIVKQLHGEKIEKGFTGKINSSYTDNLQKWFPIRIPRNADSEPENNDREMTYDLEQFCLGIGMTGWDYINRESCWTCYDFDSIIGHSERHANKLTPSELYELEQTVSSIPWITIRRSTSGTGLHLYIFIKRIKTKNHTEHSALSRCILGMMSGLVNFDFYSKIDTYGGNFWVYHDKMKGTNGLQLIKKGTILEDIPENWKDHIPVISGKRKKSIPSFIINSDQFLELTGQRARIPLDEDHKRLINYLNEIGAYCSYDSDHHILITHTYALKQAHINLKLKGVFETLATGSEHGDHNAWAAFLPKGVFAIRRYSKGIQEANTWIQDKDGWTFSYLNKNPDFKIAARICEGLEHPTGGYVFSKAEQAQKCAVMLGINLNIPKWALNKKAKLKENREKRLIVELDYDAQSDHLVGGLKGWLQEGKSWKHIFDNPSNELDEIESSNFDDVLRHLITPNNDDAGWAIKVGSLWQNEPINHINKAVKNLGFSAQETEKILGSCILKPWRLVNYPFQPETPGNREWNRNAAQLKHIPSTNKDNLNYETWNKLLNHLGEGLTEALSNNQWAKDNGIIIGGDYLKCWIASLLQHPEEPLPYLFLYSEKGNTGKSTLKEALSLLIINGVKDADKALTSQGGFNAELENAVLGTIEETDLRQNKYSYNMIKNWVTNSHITIHRKGETPYQIINNIHFIQTANDIRFLPIFGDDSRITVIKVPDLKEIIPSREFLRLLDKEAPDFTCEMLNLEIPYSNDRLYVPVITTEEKVTAQSLNKNELEQFIDENCFKIDGEIIKYSEFYDKFIEWLDPNEHSNWGKIKTGKILKQSYAYGRDLTQGSQFYVGNLSFNKPENGEKKSKIIFKDGKLIKLSEVIL